MARRSRCRLMQWVEQYRELLLARGACEKHATDRYRKITTVITACKARTLSQLRPAKSQIAIAQLTDGLADATRNHYVRALKSFSRWLTIEGLADVDVLRSLQRFNSGAEPKHPRRALTEDELARLIHMTAFAPPARRRMPSIDRAWLYAVAACTGLRAGELRRLRTDDFRLADDAPFVNVRSTITKNRRSARQPLPRTMCRQLGNWLAGRSEAAFAAMPHPSRIARMFRVDLKRAGIPYRNAAGEYADFHSLRHTYITRVVQATQDLKTVQVLARHSTIQLTLNRYAHVRDDEKHQAVDRLSVFTPSALGAEGFEPSKAFAIRFTV